MFEFRCFGSGSSGNCYFFRTEEGSFLIDAGIGIRLLKKSFKEYGVILRELSGIFITHDHADHIKAVGALANELKIPVFATEAVHLGIRRNPGVNKKPDNALVRVIEQDMVQSFCGCSITAFPVPHDSTENVGYSIKYNGKTFCLITDVGHITEVIAQHINEADYLVLEANYDELMLSCGSYPEYLKKRISGDNGHLCNDAAAMALLSHSSESLKFVWLCHLSEENNHPELVRKTVENTLKNGGFFLNHDTKITVLRRKVPSEAFFL